MEASLCCERCGYDLRTLDVAGVCPECALPIQETRNAAAEPLAADRRAIRRAALVLLIAFAARMAVLALVLLLRWVIDRNVVWPSVISQVLQPWPFDIAVSFAWRMFRPFAAGEFLWIVVQAAFAAQFAVQCVGVALLTARPQSRFTWPATLLRHAARWSAALGILLGGALRITVEAGRRTIFDLLLWEPSIWCIFVIPPIMIAAWTAVLVSRIDRRRHAQRLAWLGLITNALAAAFDERWIYNRNAGIAWSGTMLNLAAFVAVVWMCRRLWKRTNTTGEAQPVQ